MTRSELALWDKAYRIAEVAMLRQQPVYMGRHVFHQEGDTLAAHLMAEAIVNMSKGERKA